ncbi:hypothetical protein GCM10011405_01120 [Rufibacter glacialis]|nr:hypothetical protein GCM10011405_01120 [Rufibacter glacialis]
MPYLQSLLGTVKESGISFLLYVSKKLSQKDPFGLNSILAMGLKLQRISKPYQNFVIFRNGEEAGNAPLLTSYASDYGLEPFQASYKGIAAYDGFPAAPFLTSFQGATFRERESIRLSPGQRYRQATALDEEVGALLEAGYWEFSSFTGEFFCTDYLMELLNMEPGAAVESFESFLPFIKENHQEVLVDAWVALVNTNRQFSCIVEVQGTGRGATWLKMKGKPLVKNGQVVKFIGTVQNVSEWVATETQLTAEVAKAEKAAQLKTEFVSYMSHEIRTPLNAIMGLTYLLLQEEGLKEEYKDNLNSIHFSSQCLLALVNNTLDYSKIEAGKVELEKVNFPLKDLLKNTHQALYLRSMEKMVDLELCIDPRTPAEVAGDPVRLMQILNNLLSNAIKFTDRGAVRLEVKVIYQTNQEWVLDFTVSDTGIGIPQEKQSHIFESFSQASASTHRKYGGTGLGLSITKNLVDLHKGTIQVQSEPGKGSVFNVRLKFVKPQASLVTLPKTKGGKIPHTKLKGVRVLVVDDNVMNRTVATKLLSNWNAVVETADDGLVALEKMATTGYDIVLMDLYMPVLDGFQTVTRMREAGQKVPVIALTANASEEERRRILEVGVNDYLTKPFVPQDLFNKLLQNLDGNRF